MREIGASRTSVTVGAAPLVAVAIALVFLSEPLHVSLVIGALAVVAGGVLLAAERDRPGHLRSRGLLYAAGAAALFATRDNVVRALHGHASPETAAAATLVAGTVVAALWARRAPTAQELRRLAPAGVLFGLSYICLFEAYWRGRVTVVSPLVATESLWGVALAALLIRQTEGMGRRVARRRAPGRRRRSGHRRDSLIRKTMTRATAAATIPSAPPPDAGEDEDRDEDAEVGGMDLPRSRG